MPTGEYPGPSSKFSMDLEPLSDSNRASMSSSHTGPLTRGMMEQLASVVHEFQARLCTLTLWIMLPNMLLILASLMGCTLFLSVMAVIWWTQAFCYDLAEWLWKRILLDTFIFKHCFSKTIVKYLPLEVGLGIFPLWSWLFVFMGLCVSVSSGHK